MKRVLSLLMAAMAFISIAKAQNFMLKSSDYNQLQVSLSASVPEVEMTTLGNTTFSTLTLRGSVPLMQVGDPMMPLLNRMIEIPLCDSVVVTVNKAYYDTIDGTTLGLDYPIMPAQPSRSKSDHSPFRLYQNTDTYATDAFFGTEWVYVDHIGVARDRNLATLVFAPVRYNPVTRQLIVCKYADVTLTYLHADKAATEHMKAIHGSHAFGAGLNTLNTLPQTKTVRRDAPVVYQIVAHSSFRGALDSLIAWKQRKGFIVQVAYTDDPAVGTTATSIAAYLQGLYDNATATTPAPTYLLIVGDNEQIPAFSGRYGSSSHITDLYFTTWTSGDIIPDCYYGRFSAQTVAQLTPQIEKTLMYERYAFADPSFLSRGVLIAGVDGGYSNDYAYRYCDPTMDYLASTYVNAANGFSNVTYYKNNTNHAPATGGVSVTGSSQNSSTSSTLRNLYNTYGTAWVNYSAHGDVDQWYSPQLTNSQVAQMTNTQKFGFMIGNCCLTNSFQSDCIGEALLRQGNYTGAVAYFGASDYTYWAEDFYWAVGVRNNINNTMDATYDASHLGVYDRLFHTHGEAESEWYTSAGSFNMAGNMSVQSASTSSLKEYYWEVYHLMGDPSIIPWTGLASTMTVSTTPNSLFVGSTSLDVSAVPYAYVALTNGNGQLVAAAYSDANGAAHLTFDALTAPGIYELAVTAQGYRPSFTDVQVIVLDGPYIVASALTTDQASMVAGDTVTFNIALKNLGNVANDTLDIELQTEADHILLLNGGIQKTHEVINGNDSLVLNAFGQGVVWSQVADGTHTPIDVIVRWGNRINKKSTARFYLDIQAPTMVVTGSQIIGTSVADSTVTLLIHNTNQGHAPLTQATTSLLSPDPAVVITSAHDTIGTVATGATATTTYTISLDASLPESCVIPLYQTISSNGIDYTSDPVYLTVGQASSEDFETGNFNTFDWTQSSTYPWIMTNSGAHGGTYCARSNANLPHASTSTLSLQWTSSIDDTISFYRKVSSERNYDIFYFKVDNVAYDEASGNGDWERVAVFVPAGTHTFSFEYTKDYSMSSYDDCVYIDDISLPLSGTGREYLFDTICQGEPYTFHSLTLATDTLDGTYQYHDSVDHILYFLTLTVSTPPTVSVSANATTVMAGQHVALTATGADRYEWSTGATVPEIYAYPTETTTFSVRGYRGGCYDTDSITITIKGSVTVTPVDTPTPWTLYPNPASQQVRLQQLPKATNQILLYDLYGRKIHSWTVEGNSATISLEGIRPGVYLMTCGGQSRKLVVR